MAPVLKAGLALAAKPINAQMVDFFILRLILTINAVGNKVKGYLIISETPILTEALLFVAKSTSTFSNAIERSTTQSSGCR
jgi:hypothetical protein